MTSDEAQEIIATMSILPVQEIDLAVVNRAIDTHKTYQIARSDALIISVAERAGCEASGPQTYFSTSSV
jgi:predicted nucleic acid-binding protein